MRNANIERLAPPPTMPRTMILATLVAIVVGLLVTASVIVAGDGGNSVTPPQTATLTRTQQAETDRLTGLAESMTQGQALQRQEAESARWNALAEAHRRDRARQAETDRLTGLAESQGHASR